MASRVEPLEVRSSAVPTSAATRTAGSPPRPPAAEPPAHAVERGSGRRWPTGQVIKREQGVRLAAAEGRLELTTGSPPRPATRSTATWSGRRNLREVGAGEERRLLVLRAASRRAPGPGPARSGPAGSGRWPRPDAARPPCARAAARRPGGCLIQENRERLRHAGRFPPGLSPVVSVPESHTDRVARSLHCSSRTAPGGAPARVGGGATPSTAGTVPDRSRAQEG